MAYSILLVVEKAKEYDRKVDTQWQSCLKRLAELASTNKSVVQLGENVLLLSLTHTLSTLLEALWAIQGQSYKYAIFPEPIQWHEGSMEVLFQDK